MGDHVRRCLVGLMAAATAALVLVGCRPPPAPGWVPPVVTATVTPDPVTAGEPFTVEVTAVHPTAVTAVAIRIRTPTLIDGWDPVCVAGELVPAPTVTRSFECVMPEGAPNGSWSLSASAFDASGSGDYAGGQSSTFEVVGGEDDQEPPVMESVVVAPTPVVIGEPFSVTVRAFDEHHRPPSSTSLWPGLMVPAPVVPLVVSWGCTNSTPTQVEPTVLEWTFTGCAIQPNATPQPGSSPPIYGAGFDVTDMFGYTGRMLVTVQPVAG